jgi:serine O-acetyltransferase
MSTIAAIKSDLVHSAALWGMPRHRAIPRAVGKMLLYPRVRAVFLFRVSHAMWQRPAARPFALLLQNRVARNSGAEIHPAAEIGPGLSLVHSSGVVVGATSRIGANARIYQQVTIGDDGNRPGQPTIGDAVVLGAGCKILGPVTLGGSVTVAANAVVRTDIPSNSLAAGVPARVVTSQQVRPMTGPSD